MTNAALFQAADGIRFWWRKSVVILNAGMYGNGRGALQFVMDSGEALDKLTVNLADVPLGYDDGFYVRWVGKGGAALLGTGEGDSVEVYRMANALGLFFDTGRRVDQGFVTAYAALWRFSTCDSPEPGHVADYVVFCRGCLAAIEANYKQCETVALAHDAVRRMRALDEDELPRGYTRTASGIPRVGSKGRGII